MKVLLSWIREFVDVPESAEEIGRLLSVRGLALEGLEPLGDDVVMDDRHRARNCDRIQPSDAFGGRWLQPSPRFSDG